VGMVAAGYFHSIFQQGNALWAMGDNEFGQLGDGTTNNQYFPEQIISSPQYRVTGIAAGGFHSLFTTFTPGSGRFQLPSFALWAVGQNDDGELGDGTTDTTNISQEIQSTELLSDVVTAMAGGASHSLFVEEDGSLWGMGDDDYDELGIEGEPYDPGSQVMIVSNGVTAVAAGSLDSFLIESDGSLWAMGLNEYGELGNGLQGDQSGPPQQVLTGVVAVAAGYWHTLCIRSDGTLWGTGLNDAGQLGYGTNYQYDTWFPIGVSNVVAIAAGKEHSLFIKSDGSLWGMGDNYAGQLGNEPYPGPYYLQYNVPVEIVPPPSPTISSISVAGTNVVVTWPTNQGGFYLQSTTNVALPAAWSAVSPGAVIVNGQFTVTNPITGAQMFFRLSE
jgi:alpha-tubulin suppressor-like RCC1 family protein